MRDPIGGGGVKWSRKAINIPLRQLTQYSCSGHVASRVRRQGVSDDGMSEVG